MKLHVSLILVLFSGLIMSSVAEAKKREGGRSSLRFTTKITGSGSGGGSLGGLSNPSSSLSNSSETKVCCHWWKKVRRKWKKIPCEVDKDTSCSMCERTCRLLNQKP